MGIGLSLIWSGFEAARRSDERELCKSNLRRISLALAIYRRDYDERWPPAGRGEATWVRTVRAYPEARRESILFCPAITRSHPVADYWLNISLCARPQVKIELPSQTLSFGEGEGQSLLGAVPDSWLIGRNSPLRRHRQGANFAFVDGHVKWLRPNTLTPTYPRGDEATWVVQPRANT